MKDPLEAKRLLLVWARKRISPLLVGEAALILGPLCSLREAEGLLSELVHEGSLRPLTEKELREKDLRYGFSLV